ncbi:MAG: LysM protein [Sphingomonadales bacterium]|nr:LysM protein [Sphingomonadales bacterium]
MTGSVRILSLLAVLTLAACSHGPKSHPGMIQPISNRVQFEDAVGLLMDGKVKAAREMLGVMAKRDPFDRRTAMLMQTLDVDPVAALGARSFNYRVQASETMTGLSQRFLGDRLKFYLLARYNDIAVPKALVAGQLLRIPGVAPSVAPAPAHNARRIRDEPTREAAPTGAPKPAANPTTSVEMKRHAVQLRGAGLAALNTGKVNRAVALLRQANAADPTSTAIKSDLARAVRIQATVAAKR